jgi:hypothetical protein
MAANAPTTNRSVKPGDGSVIQITWTLTTADPTGAWAEWPQHTDRCATAFAAAWGGATLTWQGSNDGTNAFTMSDASDGSDATQTADGGKQLLEAARFVRPKLTAVGVGATVTADLVAVRKR